LLVYNPAKQYIIRRFIEMGLYAWRRRKRHFTQSVCGDAVTTGCSGHRLNIDVFEERKMKAKVSLMVFALLVTASLANAGLVINIIDGVNVRISNEVSGGAATYQGFWALVADPTKIVISGGNTLTGTGAPNFNNVVGKVSNHEGLAPIFAPQDGIWGQIADIGILTGNPMPSGTWFDNISITYTPGVAPVLISLLPFDDDGVVGSALATATVYVIPEPATVVLLGLGGMILRGKKSKDKR
jgi:hypothetical protein